MEDVFVVDTDSGEVTRKVVPPFVRTMYNYDMMQASDESGLFCDEPTRAQQQFKEECDINTIVERFGITGEMPEMVNIPHNVDFAESLDYHSAYNQMLAADAAFMEFPAHIREKFGNNAGKFVDFVSDPANIEQCREWGIARAVPKAAEPMLVRMAPEESKDQ